MKNDDDENNEVKDNNFVENKINELDKKLNEKKFMSKDEEIIYYKLKYKKYKTKFLQLNEDNKKIIQEKYDIFSKFENIQTELNSEKILRKSYQEKVNTYMKNELSSFKQYIPIINSNLVQEKSSNSNGNINNYDLEEEKLDEDINDDKTDKIYSNSKENINTTSKNNITSNDSKMTSSSLIEKNINTITSKFNSEIVYKSLITDFLEYDKDTILLRKKILLKEEKINTLEKIIENWIQLSGVLKKGLNEFINALSNFNDNLSKEVIETFEECPDLISLIYLLQSALNDIINQFKYFSCSIDNSFTDQLQLFINHNMSEYKENKQTLNKHIENFNYYESKFLNIKKSNIKENQREDYISKYKLVEFTKFDYINKINMILMYIKIELPEKISLLTYALISLFRHGYDLLNKVENTINDNLEKISVKYQEKEKLNTAIKNKKKLLGDSLTSINLNIKNKEGFLYVKEKNSNNYFKKRYVKIFNGFLYYYKLYHNTNDVDQTNYFQLCNLLLSNVKKNEKEYEYPFCFEVICANDQKAYLFQANTQPECDEWINAITNAISNQISSYQAKGNNTNNIFNSSNNDNSSNSNKDNEPRLSLLYNNNSENVDNIIIKYDKESKNCLINEGNNHFNIANNPSFDEFVVIKKKAEISPLDNLINKSKCVDCGSNNPSWLSSNWLCLICIDCSSIHRSLGVQISKIKSLKLDNFDPDYIEIIDNIGLEKINSILEYGVKSYEKPNPNSMFTEKEIFITNKYKNKKYFKTLNKKDREEPSTNIFKFIENDDLLNIYFYLKLNLCEINKLYSYKEDKYAFIHHAAKTGKIKSFKLLAILGANCSMADSKGLKPIDYATIYKFSNIADYIIKKMEEIN